MNRKFLSFIFICVLIGSKASHAKHEIDNGSEEQNSASWLPSIPVGIALAASGFGASLVTTYLAFGTARLEPSATNILKPLGNGNFELLKKVKVDQALPVYDFFVENENLSVGVLCFPFSMFFNGFENEKLEWCFSSFLLLNGDAFLKIGAANTMLLWAFARYSFL